MLVFIIFKSNLLTKLPLVTSIASVTIASAFDFLLHCSKPIKLRNLIKIAPASLAVTNSTLSIASTTCTNPTTLLAPSTENFTPSPLTIFWFQSRSDGQADILCAQAWTIYVENPSVACLGPLTLGRSSKQPPGKPPANRRGTVGPQTPSSTPGLPVGLPRIRSRRAIRVVGGDSLSNFLLSITHELLLMMATSVRGRSSTAIRLLRRQL